MHVRRALLLFAIVLGLAALATSISQPGRESGREERSEPPTAPSAAPQIEPPTGGELALPGPRNRRTVTLRTGDATTLVVTVPEAGQVDLPTLGLTASAEELTPARFELLLQEPATHRVRFQPSESGVSRDYGRVVVR